ncbi:T9SS type A sorting domain-containing protein [Bernardetia litoralis]|uniref:T9SS type A sorting domain-containing protein n=1 Tax=Bernardetia litoralis TaxID=999 RepID=UPI00030338DC|nr:T9SS type A sorting domain-containing protein [Bernardetia litoralis]
MNNLAFYCFQNKPFLFGKGLFLGDYCNGNQAGMGKIAVKNSKISELVIYPNPAQTEITIHSPTKIQTIEISNGLGQVVSAKNADTKKVDLNIINLSKGIYFVKILLEDNTIQVKKLIIQ